ncbi:MAG: EamA family transporter [Acidobacteria bacterium]|nr:EamA family transporter [Acidobacteriota bacterium]
MMRWLLVAGVVVATVFADLLQSSAMKGEGMRRRYTMLATSVIFMALSFFSFLKLLEVAEYSFAVPATAASIVIETALASVLLKEQVGFNRWAGAACVAAGVWLVGQ